MHALVQLVIVTNNIGYGRQYVLLQPKRALENFVEAGGLVCLQKVLVIWMRKPATHTGALLILKVRPLFVVYMLLPPDND